jgi:type II restriction enzyme
MGKTDISKINAITTGHKYVRRCNKIINLGYDIEFNSFDDSTFKLNLEMIDSKFPEIIAYVVKDKFLNGRIHFKDIFKNLNKVNPVGYDLSEGHEFYEYRLTNFLVESALGMTSKKVLSGRHDVIGGIIIVKPNTDILCFHLIDFNNFKDYLITNAKVDSPGGSKMGYGTVYEENGKSFIKLNFQIKV